MFISAFWAQYEHMSAPKPSTLDCDVESPPLLITTTAPVPCQVYAVALGLCVASAKSAQPSRNRSKEARDDDGDQEDTAPPDEAGTDSVETGRSLGRLVVDGCCHEFAEALNMVRVSMSIFQP